MKLPDLNRKCNFTATLALVWALGFGFIAFLFATEEHPIAPLPLLLPLGVLLGGIFGYGHGIAMFYFCRLLPRNKLYE
jgi:hypothetical protein